MVYSPSQLGCCCCVDGLGGLPFRQEFRQPKQKRRVFKVLSSSSSQLDPCGRVIRSTLLRFTTETPFMKLGFICLNVPAIIGKHGFLDKASIQPQQTSDYTNIVQQVMSAGRVPANQMQIKSTQMQTQCLLNLSDKAFVDKARLIGRNGGFRRAQC